MQVTAPFGQDVIQRILPHRHPFLLIDRVEELDLEKRIICLKAVQEDEYYLAPGPADTREFPMTLLAEVVAQAGAMLVLLRPGLEGRRIYFMSIDNFELQRPVHRLPGQGEPLRRPIHKPGVEVDVRAGQACDHFGEVGIQLDATLIRLERLRVGIGLGVQLATELKTFVGNRPHRLLTRLVGLDRHDLALRM